MVQKQWFLALVAAACLSVAACGETGGRAEEPCGDTQNPFAGRWAYEPSYGSPGIATIDETTWDGGRYRFEGTCPDFVVVLDNEPTPLAAHFEDPETFVALREGYCNPYHCYPELRSVYRRLD